MSATGIKDEGKWQGEVQLEDTGLVICHKSFGVWMGVGEADVHESLKCQENQPVITSAKKPYKSLTVI